MGDTEEYNAENLNYEAEGDGAGAEEEMEDPELEDIKARVRAMEEEAEKLKLLQSEVGDFFSPQCWGSGTGSAGSACF
jgi:hypothetical protein